MCTAGNLVFCCDLIKVIFETSIFLKLNDVFYLYFIQTMETSVNRKTYNIKKILMCNVI